MVRLAVAVLTLTLVCLWPSAADAQSSKTPTWKQKRKAKGYVLRGNRYKAQGDRARRRKRAEAAEKNYKKAAYVYIAAFKLHQRASTIYKLANVFVFRGEMDWALRGYKRYLELKPTGGASRRAKRLVARLSVVVKGQRRAGTLKEGDPAIDPSEVYGDKEEPPPDKDPDPPPDKDPDPPPDKDPDPKPVKKIVKVVKPERPQPGRTFRLAGMGSIGVGVVLLVVGIKFGLDASSASSDLSNNDDAWTDADRQRIRDGESASNKMVLFTLIGSAAIVGGGWLYLRGKKLGRRKSSEKPERAKVTWVPSVTPRSLSVAVIGRF